MNKYIQKFRENIAKLDEAKQVGLLYHNTPNLTEILKSNKLISHEANGISFDTEEGWFNDGPWDKDESFYTLIFDGNKLSENNKIIEVTDTAHEIKVIPPHQNIEKIEDKVNDLILDFSKKYNISKNDLINLSHFVLYGDFTDEDYAAAPFTNNAIDIMAIKIKKFLINHNLNVEYNPEIDEKIFTLSLGNKVTNFPNNNYSKLEYDFYNLIYYMRIAERVIDYGDYPYTELAKPYILNNLNKYIIGLIVRYPEPIMDKRGNEWRPRDQFRQDVYPKEYSIQDIESKQLEKINNGIKLFKNMYPNLPVYLRDENGYKTLLKKNEINELPEMKSFKYPSRNWNKHLGFDNE